ncbi:response regulator transcription factor [Streptomyces sp. NPDC047515]|uniref:response regulator transcription factor n=1 Tax=Streptomyces sp. NPDC047515 TaxID=3155380 RepID=UPI0033D357D4
MITIKALIAEDMTVVREGLVAVLGREPGIDVVAQAAHGDEVFPAALATRPDAAVLDVAMPGQDGVTTARELTERLTSCRTLVLTVLDRPGHLRAAREAGAAGYLLKSASARQVVAAIRTVAAGGTVYDSGLLAEERSAGASPLTPRETEILRLAAQGMGAAETAAELFLSVRTVRNHLSLAARAAALGGTATAERPSPGHFRLLVRLPLPSGSRTTVRIRHPQTPRGLAPQRDTVGRRGPA